MTTSQTTNPRQASRIQADSEDRLANVSPTPSDSGLSLGRHITRLARLAANEHARQVNQVSQMNQVNQSQLDHGEGARK